MLSRAEAKRLDNLERLVREMHAVIVSGNVPELKPGSFEIKRAAEEMLNGNMTLVKALGNKKMAPGLRLVSK